MRKAFILVLCVLSLGFVTHITPQQRTGAAVEASDREKDGLIGPVRRVTVETAKITIKNGTPTEGPRVLREVATYDPRGNKTDNLAYPAAGSNVPGKEVYKYDNKGNIIEMELRAPDGGLLSKELYKYVLDELGNWKQMTTSLALFEDGKVTSEPVEVTYRTISYFYTQEIAKLTSNSSTRSSSTVRPTLGQASISKPESSSLTSDAALSESSGTRKETSAAAPPIVQPQRNMTAGGEVSENAAYKPTEALNRPTSKSVPSVRRVSEETLRNAALSLPEPAYPEAAELSRVQGRVPVEVIIDEKGAVTKAHATSSHPLLNQAAETAALAARFAPATLSQDASIVTGIISYDFVLPKPKPALEPVANNASDGNQQQLAESSNTPKLSASTSALSTAPSQPVASESAVNLYRQGVSYLVSGRNAEAVQALSQAVYKDPEFANAYAKLGLAYAASRQNKEAIASFKLAIKIKREVMDAEAYYRMGLSYTALGKNSDALGAFKQSLYITRAETIAEQGPATDRVPSIEDLHYNMGLAYYNLARYDDSIKELQQVVAANPRMAEAYYGLAVCYISMGDRRSAERQQKLLEPLNRDLAARIGQALLTNRIAPPGLNDGMLNGRRRY